MLMAFTRQTQEFLLEQRKIDQITTEEMLELSSQGSKVLQPRAVEFAGKYDIGIRVLSTFEEGTGTSNKKRK